MNTSNNKQEKGLNNDVQQNRGVDKNGHIDENSEKPIGTPVNNGGVSISANDIHLEKQWLAVRDEYLANFPELNNMDTNYEKGDFSTLITNLAERRKQTPETIYNEIMNWSSK